MFKLLKLNIIFKFIYLTNSPNKLEIIFYQLKFRTSSFKKANILKSWKERIPVFILPQKVFLVLTFSSPCALLPCIGGGRGGVWGNLGSLQIWGALGGGINLCIHELSQYLKVSHQYVVNFLFSISQGKSSNYGAA